MKKTTILFVSIILIAIVILGGCRRGLPEGKFSEEQMKRIPYANKYDLPEASGGMVLGIYSETITAEEIINLLEPGMKSAAQGASFEAFERQAVVGFREAVRGKVTDILLYQEARKTAPENIDDQLDKAVETEVVRFVASYNNNYALAEAAIKEMGMNWKTFRDYQKKLIMTQSHLSSAFEDDKRYSYQELLARYNAVKASQYCQSGSLEFSLIDIIPEKVTDEQKQEGETAEAAAKRIADDLVKELLAGADFAELAKESSHGPLAKLGGKWRPVTIGANSLAKPYDAIEGKALDMAAGQIRGPIAVEGRYFIIKLHRLEEGGCLSFEEVQDQIAQQLRFQNRQDQYQKLVRDLILKADIVQIEHFIEFCVKQAYQQWS